MERVKIKQEEEKKEQHGGRVTERVAKVKKYEGEEDLAPKTKQHKGLINSRVKLALLAVLNGRPGSPSSTSRLIEGSSTILIHGEQQNQK